MKKRRVTLITRLQQPVALLLVYMLSVGSALAGITITGSNGITATGADGIQYIGTSGITATGADGVLTFAPNGITATGADGITATGADGITATGADGITATGADGITATGADSLTIAWADGITATGADGITATGADGVIYQLDAIDIRFPTGITATGADGITATGADGITATGADGRDIAQADGITATGADGITITGADGITATGADGQVFTISTEGLHLTGADLVVVAGAGGISIRGAQSFTNTGLNALISNLLAPTDQSGIRSVDPELAVKLNQLTDDSNVNAVLVYHQLPTEADIADLQNAGIVGGTRFRALPFIVVTATRSQIVKVSQLSAIRSIYGNRTLSLNSEPEVRALTGVDRVWQDLELIGHNANLPLTGRNITVAVLDTGIDSTHGDLQGRITRNIKLADTQSFGVGFNYPVNSESLANTDQVHGHGTFVAGVIAGNGSLSSGRYSGVAPNAQLVGLSAGDLTLLYVLGGFDYLLSNAQLGVKVVNCSFSANTAFDVNDPVNVATKLLADSGINVVFSAGNTGPGAHTLNPYAVAPWVVSVGATDIKGRLANFSSRGGFASRLFRPTLVAPGVSVVSLRGSGIVNVTSTLGLAGSDTQRLSTNELTHYTTASGTSFSAPQVAGTIALMLEANPSLSPAEIRDILQRTATPLAPYYQHEAGAGMLNAHAAVIQAAFTKRRLGAWRNTIDQGQVELINAPTHFSGTADPGANSDISVQIPENTAVASIQVAWGPMLSTNDLDLQVFDQTGILSAESANVNLPGLTGKRERVILNKPAAGTWRVRVRHKVSLLASSQQFVGVLEIGEARYRRLNDVGGLNPTLREDVYQSVRSFSMLPVGVRFRPEFGVKRADLAAAMVLGARVPQYLPVKPSYQDARDLTTMLFVESVQAAPQGSLFVDVQPGGSFRPNDGVTRLAATVALVRAAGLRKEAEANAGALLPYLDADEIPSELRGYVKVAVQHGLMQANTMFHPQTVLLRAELATALAALQRRVS